MARQEDSAVMLSTFALLSVNSAKHLEADGILDLCLRLMLIRADKSAVAAINRALRMPGIIC